MSITSPNTSTTTTNNTNGNTNGQPQHESHHHHENGASSSSGVSSTSVPSSSSRQSPSSDDVPSQYFFDRSTNLRNQSQQDQTLIDSFSLFNQLNGHSTLSNNNINTTTPRYMNIADSGAADGDDDDEDEDDDFYHPQTIVFNRQQFQQQWNQKYYQNYQNAAAPNGTTNEVEIHELDDDEIENPDFLDHPATADGHMLTHGDITEEQIPNEVLMTDEHYENYMIDYDADYDQYYDHHHHQQQQNRFEVSGPGRPVQGYSIQEGVVVEEEEEEDDIEYYSHPGGGRGYSVGEPEVSMDLMSDAKTYGLMLPPYHQYKQNQQQQQQQQQQMIHPQFQMLQHPYMYGNPFSYNLHTILEESENETSSLQTISSMTSSNFPSLQYEPTSPLNSNQLSSLATTSNVAAKLKSSILGELSDPSAESGSSSPSSSPPLKAKFPKNRAKKSAKTNNNSSNKRSSGSNYSDISFSSSSTFSDPSISDRSNSDRSEEGEEEEEEEEEVYVTKPIVSMNPASIITQDDDSTHNSSIMLSDIDADVMSTTSKLERYFTSSLLEAQRKRNNMPKVMSPDSNGLDAEPLIATKPTPKITPIIVVEPPPDEDLDESEESNEIQITKQSQTVQQSSVVEPKKVSKFNLLSQILTALLLDPQTPTIEQLNRLNQNHLRLDWIRVLQSFTTRNTQVIQHASTIRKLLLRNLSLSELQKYTNIYLTNYRKSVDAVHIVRDHRLMGKSIQTLKSAKTQQRAKHRRKSKESIEETQQSQIQIRINQGQSTIIINNTPPKVPQRTRKTVQIQQNPVDPNKTIYRTVLQINDFNDPALASGPGQMQNAKLSKLLNQSNPLNRNFLAKTLLNETQEDSENQIEHINSQPNETEHSKGKKAPQKSPKNIINSSTQLLLGSLRSRSKERSKWQDTQPQDHVMIESRNQNNGKFKTISNIGRSSNGTKGHSKLSSTKSDALDQNGHQEASNGGSKKLDRSSKGSKSFRDQRSSQSAATHNTTWDSIYGGGMKLLKNISFVRSRNRASTPKDHPERVNSRESLSSNDSHKSDSSGSNGPSRSKSLSEPNLHKSARARVRAKASKDQSSERATVKSTPQLTTTTTSSSSASNYSDTTMRIHENGSNNSDQHTATVSTPSLLYRLSNSSMINSGLGASAPGVNAMRSISTSSLRTRRRPEPGDRVSSAVGGVGVHHLETQLNGEWQKMQTTSNTTQAEVPQYSASPSWSKSTPSLQRTTATFQVISPGSPSPANRPPSSLAQYSSIINPSSHTLSRESNDSKPNTIELLSSPASTSSTTVAGEIALSLNYDMRIGSLEISIHKCRIDVIGKQKADLYVKVYLLPDRVKANKRKTRIVKAFKSAAARSSNQLQAEFNETLRFIGPFGEFTGRRMLLSIWNSDKFGRNGPVAETVLGPLDLSMLSSGQLSELRWYRVMEPLHPTANQRASSPSPLEHSISKKSGEAAQHGQSTPTPKLKARSTVDMLKSPNELVDESKFAGTIFVAMKYQTESEQGSHHQSDYHPSQEKGSLNILIKEAQNLQFAITAANIIGSTFCKLSLQPERSKQDHEKSTPIKCPLEYSANPRWNQTFVFQNLTASELSVRSLELSVWFQVEHGMQKSGKKLFVGGVRLSSSITESTTEETTIWNQLLDRPNMWAYGEILLRELK